MDQSNDNDFNYSTSPENDIKKNKSFHISDEENDVLSENEEINDKIALKEDDNEKDENFSYFESVKKISYSAIPVTIVYITSIVVQTININFASHFLKGKNRLNAIEAIGMCTSYSNIFIRCLILSIVWVFQTVGGNAIGAEKIKLYGLYFQRIQFISYSLAFIILITHYFLYDKIFTFFGIGKNVMIFINEYMKCMLLSQVFEIQLELNISYLITMGESWIHAFISLGGMILHPLFCYLLFSVFDLGFKSLGISNIITSLNIMIAGCIYIYIIKPLPQSIFCYGKKTFTNLWPLLKLIIFSSIWIIAEWAGHEILTILAINLGNTNYNIYVVLDNLYFLSYYWAMGFEIYVAISIAGLIGKKQTNSIKKMCYTVMCIVLCLSFIIGLIFLIFRYQILSSYLNNKKMINRAMPLLPIVSINIFLSLSISIVNGICYGLGKYIFPSFISLTSGLGLCTGLSYLFAIKLNYGLIGILLSYTLSCVMMLIQLLIYLYFLNFEKIVEETYARIEKDKIQNPETDEDDISEAEFEIEKLKEN